MKLLYLFLTINFSAYLCKVFYIKHDEDYLFYFN